jgi:hypothetical protein
MSKERYSIELVDKTACKTILDEHHYLSKESKGFKTKFNFGLFHNDELVGVCIYTGFPVPELSKGLFGLERNDQDGLFELSRLCLLPHVQNTEHNITSWFVSRTIKKLRKITTVRCVLSYADDSKHSGTIYRACNFKYYGTSSPRKDFWILQNDGTYVKHSRGKTKGVKGEWRPRSLKHRFLMVFDKSLTVKWQQQR